MDRIEPDIPQTAGAGETAELERRCFDASIDYILILAPDGAILDANTTALMLAGPARAELEGLAVWELPAVPQGRSGAIALRAAVSAAAGGAPVRYDTKFIVGDGRIVLDLSVRPVLDDEGRVHRILVEGRDITDRKAAEDSVRESKERYNRIVAIANDAILSIDEDQNLTMFNEGAERIFGFTAREILGRPLTVLMPAPSASEHPGLVAGFGESVAVSRRMAERSHIFGRRKNGEVFPAEASISKARVNGRLEYTAILRDVSDQWAREEERTRLLAAANDARVEAERVRERLAFVSRASDALNESLDYDKTLHSLAELLVQRVATLCMVDVIEPDGTVRRVEAAHADPSHAATAAALQRVRLEADSSFWSRTALHTGTTQFVPTIDDAYLQLQARDDAHLALLRSLRPRSSIVVPLTARGRTLGSITLVRDDTMPAYTKDDVGLAESVAWRAAIAIDNSRLYRQSDEASAQRDLVMGIVSHDLGNALSAMSLNAAALASAAGADDEQRARTAETLRESIAWMRRLIADLLDISSIEAGRLSLEIRPTDPLLLVGRAVHIFDAAAAGRNVSIELIAPDDLPAIDADEARILQVLVNLLVNALKFTNAGGRITVRAAADEDAVVFEVKDSGPGIPAADVPRIFDRFFHAGRPGARSGAGLGLAIAKGIVDGHNGRIWVNTRAGAGATFGFRLPRSAGLPRRPSDDDET